MNFGDIIQLIIGFLVAYYGLRFFHLTGNAAA